jgi:YspA, cpYpsA-related SLOG family
MRSEEPLHRIRVLVTGSRTWADPDAVWRALDEVIERFPGRLVVLVHGDAARGADRHAAAWAARREREGQAVTVESHPADWARDGRAAGFRRNLRMVAAGADLCLTFIARCVDADCTRSDPHGTHGAVHCATAARVAGIPVQHIRVQSEAR